MMRKSARKLVKTRTKCYDNNFKYFINNLTLLRAREMVNVLMNVIKGRWSQAVVSLWPTLITSAELRILIKYFIHPKSQTVSGLYPSHLDRTVWRIRQASFAIMIIPIMNCTYVRSFWWMPLVSWNEICRFYLVLLYSTTF